MAKFYITGAFLGLLLLRTGHLYGQPTEEMIREMEALSISGQTEELLSVKLQVEEYYLEKARHNIENYRKSGAALTFVNENGQPLENIRVEINQVTQDFLFGNKLFELILNYPEEKARADEFKERYKALFNFAVFPFFWAADERTASTPEWKKKEDALNWALENRIACKGTPLGWTSPHGTPQWLLDLPEQTATELYKARLYNHVIGYKGKVDTWILVNEPVNTVPWDIALEDKENNNDLRYNIRGYGTSDFAPWVDQSFKWAFEANPDGNYILNEYFTLAIPEIRDRFNDLLEELRKRNTPVSGIGIQGHEPREMWFSPIEVFRTFDLYKEFGLPLHITEFIPQSSGKDITGWRGGTWTEEAQAEFAEQFYTLAFGHPAVASITWWGFTDRRIWLEGGGLLDEEYNPKPVYNRLMKLIKEEWMTKDLNLKTDKNGQVSFRGFYGTYQVVATRRDGTSQTLDIHLKDSETNYWKFALE